MTQFESEAVDLAGPAAVAPERLNATPVAHAVGVGPGDPAYLSDRAGHLIADADVVVGFETVVDVVADRTDGVLLRCGYDDQPEMLDRFAERVGNGADGVAVFMGDPNVSGYELLGRVETAVDGPIRVVPGVSSIQVAASRARTPLDRSTVVSLHRRGPLGPDLERLVADVGQRHLVVLPRPYDWMPADVAAHLAESGANPDLQAIVYEHLTQEAETATHATLGELAADAGGSGPDDSAFSDLSIVVVRADDAQATSRGGPQEGP